MDKRKYGEYVLFLNEPENELGKYEYIKQGVSRILDGFAKAEIVPNWDTVQLIVKEGVDFLPTLDWYDGEDENGEKEEGHGPTFCWQMTVAVKFDSENYPETSGE